MKCAFCSPGRHLAHYSVITDFCCFFRSRAIMNETEDEPKDLITLNYKKLSADEISALVISPCCGAVTLFVGGFNVHSMNP